MGFKLYVSLKSGDMSNLIFLKVKTKKYMMHIIPTLDMYKCKLCNYIIQLNIIWIVMMVNDNIFVNWCKN